MSSLTEEQLRREFRRIDKDNDGSITVEELKKFYLPMQEMLGCSPQGAEQEIIGVLKRLDTDHSRTISVEGKNEKLIEEKRKKIFFIVLFFAFRIQIVFQQINSFFLLLQKINPVSYTHLDVYKRQA